MENVSPAPPAPTPSQQQQQQPVTVTTEPPKVTQTVDTTFITAAQTGKQTTDMTAADPGGVFHCHVILHSGAKLRHEPLSTDSAASRRGDAYNKCVISSVCW